MQLTTPSVPDDRPAVTPLVEKLLNIFVSPGEVFEEVVVSPPTPACWLVPLLFVCLTGIISLLVMPARELGAGEVRQLVEWDASASLEIGKHSHHGSELAILTVT